MHIIEWGDLHPERPALVLLHGGAVTCRTWGPFCSLLAHKYRLITVDMRGHGDSEWPRDGEATHNLMAEDLRHIIRVLNLNKPVVVGHSVGGLLLMRLMVHSPELLGGAVLVDIGLETNYKGWIPKTEASEVIGRCYETLEDYAIRQAPRMKRSEEQMLRIARHEIMQRSTDGLYQVKFDPRHPMGGPDASTMPGLPDLVALQEVELPTLVARGEHSWFLPQESAEMLSSALPQGELAVISNCEHLVYMDNPIDLANVIDQFVEKKWSNLTAVQDSRNHSDSALN